LIGIASFTAEGLVRGANDAFVGMIGYSREELVTGQVRCDRLTPAEWRTPDPDANDRGAGKVQPHVVELLRRDGRQ
jgi:PAS domain-containing protein